MPATQGPPTRCLLPGRRSTRPQRSSKSSVTGPASCQNLISRPQVLSSPIKSVSSRHWKSAPFSKCRVQYVESALVSCFAIGLASCVCQSPSIAIIPATRKKTVVNVGSIEMRAPMAYGRTRLDRCRTARQRAPSWSMKVACRYQGGLIGLKSAASLPCVISS